MSRFIPTADRVFDRGRKVRLGGLALSVATSVGLVGTHPVASLFMAAIAGAFSGSLEDARPTLRRMLVWQLTGIAVWLGLTGAFGRHGLQALLASLAAVLCVVALLRFKDPSPEQSEAS